MNTTAGTPSSQAFLLCFTMFYIGSFALLGSVVPRDAGVAAKLRASGAVKWTSESGQ